jgi:pimeloyl-ACP methyl ester carboxylesterase
MSNRIARRLPLRSLWMAVVVGVTALSVLMPTLALAQAPNQRPKPDGAKPTVVLVHGAWADASSWNRVARRLQREGYTVLAPPNPLRGLASDAAYVAGFLDTVPGPIVLVGHSYGGAVITNAAANKPNVKALVYVAAYIPDVGDNVFALTGQHAGSHIVPPGQPGANLTPRPFALPDGTHGVDLYISTDSFRDIFADGVAAEKTAVMAVTQRPVTLGAFQDSSLTEPCSAQSMLFIATYALSHLQLL